MLGGRRGAAIALGQFLTLQSQFRILIRVKASNALPASIRYRVAGAMPISPASSLGPISFRRRHFFMIKPKRTREENIAGTKLSQV